MPATVENYLRKETNRRIEMDISAIKALYKNLKKARVVLDWGEFAKKIGYTRTYVSRVINGHEILTKEFIEAIKKRQQDGTFSVPRETKIVSDLPTQFGDIQERLLRTEAHLEVFESAIAGLLSKSPGDFTKKVGELRKAVQEAANRRFDELQRKFA